MFVRIAPRKRSLCVCVLYVAAVRIRRIQRHFMPAQASPSLLKWTRLVFKCKDHYRHYRRSGHCRHHYSSIKQTVNYGLFSIYIFFFWIRLSLLASRRAGKLSTTLRTPPGIEFSIFCFSDKQWTTMFQSSYILLLLVVAKPIANRRRASYMGSYMPRCMESFIRGKESIDDR